jgi:hypothetical protein
VRPVQVLLEDHAKHRPVRVSAVVIVQHKPRMVAPLVDDPDRRLA